MKMKNEKIKVVNHMTGSRKVYQSPEREKMKEMAIKGKEVIIKGESSGANEEEDVVLR